MMGVNNDTRETTQQWCSSKCNHQMSGTEVVHVSARLNFVTMMCERHQGDDQWLQRWMFTDEATFHVSGRVNTHNCLIWGTENPHLS